MPDTRSAPLPLDKIPELIALARSTGKEALARAIEAEVEKARRLGEMPVIRVEETAVVAKFEGERAPGQRPFEIIRSQDLN